MTSLEPLPPSPWPIQARPREVADLIVEWFNRYYEDVGEDHVEGETGSGEEWVQSVLDRSFYGAPDAAITRALSELNNGTWRRRRDGLSEASAASEQLLVDEVGALIVTEMGEAISLGYGPDMHPTELQRRLLDLERDVEALSGELERYPALLGHNRPPEGFRLHPDDFEDIRSAIVDLTGELAKPDRETEADAEVVDRAGTKLSKVIERLRTAAKYLAVLVIEEVASQLLTDPAALVQRLQSIVDTCALWVGSLPM